MDILKRYSVRNLLSIAECNTLDEVAKAIVSDDAYIGSLRRARGIGRRFWKAFVAKYPETKEFFVRFDMQVPNSQKLLGYEPAKVIALVRVEMVNPHCFATFELEGSLDMVDADKKLADIIKGEFYIRKITYRRG